MITSGVFARAAAGSTWDMATLLNHFKMHKEHIASPKVGQEVFVYGMGKRLIGLNKRLPLNRETLAPIIDKLQRLYEEVSPYLLKDEEGKWYSNLEAAFSIDSYEELKHIQNSSKTVECRECGIREAVTEWEDYDAMSRFEHAYNAFKCLDCGTYTRKMIPSEFEDISDKSVDFDCLWDNFKYSLESFMGNMEAANFTGLKVEGRNLNWRGSSGHAYIDLDVDKLIDTITVRGDYSLHVEILKDNTISASCSHHDATSSYEVTGTVSCDHFEDPIDVEGILDAELRAKSLSNLSDDYGYIRITSEAFWECIDQLHINELLSDAQFELIKEIPNIELNPKLTEIISEVIQEAEAA